jgi:hypothetical protein
VDIGIDPAIHPPDKIEDGARLLGSSGIVKIDKLLPIYFLL